jgi:hypothetical protein
MTGRGVTLLAAHEAIVYFAVMSACGTKRTLMPTMSMSASWG